MTRKSAPQPTTHSVKICPQCQQFLGRSYPYCTTCREIVERPIKASWQTLLHAQNIAPATPAEQKLVMIVLDQSDEYWWSEVEAAMRLTSCPACRGSLGYGASDCKECIWRSDMLWGRDLEVAPEGTILRNEHAMRVIIRGLGQSHRHSAASIEGWRLYLPFLLHGPQPGATKDDRRYAQAINAWIKSGRGHELAACHTIEEMYEITRRGRK
ncbi:MAG TPA: hypothetical protein VFU49_19960 [Ktedonobacteraceae bacterium]|nr:hypothetical protein [Ktedonobacteraceae bacterium]